MLYLLLFALALFSSSILPALPHFSIVLLILLIGLLALFKRYFLIAICLIGFAISCLHGHYLMRQMLPDRLEGQLIRVTGVIQSIPRISERKTQFAFRIDQAGHSQPSVDVSVLLGHTVRLNYYHIDPQQLPFIKPGQYWEFTVKLRRPRGFVNPSGFDYQAYLLRQGIYASGYISAKSPGTPKQYDCQGVLVECLRWRTLQKMDKYSSDKHSLAVIAALGIGYSHRLSDHYWELLKETGTIHLMAISGLHIGLAAMFGYWIGVFIGRFIQWVPFWSMAHYYLPSLLSLLLAGFYSLMAGMSLPTVRALVMVVAFHVGRVLYRKINPFALLSLALVVIAFIDPLAIYSSGFWLSFLAVLALISGFYQRRYTYQQSSISILGRSLWQLGYGQYYLTLMLFLPSLLWLQGISIIAPVANVVAVTYVSFIVVPCIAIVLLLFAMDFNGLSLMFFGFAETVVQWLMRFLAELVMVTDSIDVEAFQYFSFNTAYWIVLLVCLLGLLFLFLPTSLSSRLTAVFCFLPLFFYQEASPFYKEASPFYKEASTFYERLSAPNSQISVSYNNKQPILRVTFLDVGQGTAVVIETHRHTLVYDVGKEYSPRFNIGRDVIARYLRSIGRDKVDKLLVSHSDSDHAGGIDGLLSSVDVQSALLGQRLPLTLAENVSWSLCESGQRWQWGGVNFTVLWPDRKQVSLLNNDNNHSCVLLIEYEGKTVLLSGDIEKEVESSLLSAFNTLQLSSVDVLLVPHHGSKTSSHPQWVRQLKPLWAVVTAGYRNHYHHPHPVVVDRYRRNKSLLLDTAELGYIQFFIQQQDGVWQSKIGRLDDRRYWY